MAGHRPPGLAPSRLGPIVDALRRCWPPRASRRRPLASRAPDPVHERRQSPTPTFTMLALGAQVGVWIERIVVIAFVLTAIGLALALA